MSSVAFLNSFNYYLSWFCFIVTLIVELVLFAKLRFKMDKAAICLMLTMLLVAASRVIFVELDASQIDALIGFMPVVAALIQSILMYYFVFEMIFIAAILKSDSNQELEKTKRNIFIMRAIAAVIIIFFSATLLGISVIAEYYPQFYLEHLTIIRQMLVIRFVSKLTVEIPLFYQFIVCFFFFVNAKLANDSSKTYKHRFIIAWTLALWFLDVYERIAGSIIAGIYQGYKYQEEVLTESFMLVFIFSLRTLNWLTDLLTAITLAYLFYCQAVGPKEQKQATYESIRDTIIIDDEENNDKVNSNLNDRRFTVEINTEDNDENTENIYENDLINSLKSHDSMEDKDTSQFRSYFLQRANFRVSIKK